MQDGVCAGLRLVLGSVAFKPWRLIEVEQLVQGRRLDPALCGEAAQLAVRGARALVSTGGSSNATKIRLTAALVQRALLNLLEV